MPASPNALQWDGAPGHYEVYYLTLTDPGTGVGLWIRYSLLAPEESVGAPSCALWFLTMDPRPGQTPVLALKTTLPAQELIAQVEPFHLRMGQATLTDRGMQGTLPGAAWDLRWAASPRTYEHVHPLLRRARVAQTVLTLPHPDLLIDGTVSFGAQRLEIHAARGAQAHLWGSKHARSWAWAHCNDFRTLDGDRVPGSFVDGVSVIVRRMGREVGPSTPVVGRIDGQDFRSISPLRVISNRSTFALTGWRFEAVDGARKLIGEVDAAREQLAGVTYRDPDGELRYCYNSETAAMRLHVYERARKVGGWAHRSTLISSGRAHFEYAQPTPVPDLPLLL